MRACDTKHSPELGWEVARHSLCHLVKNNDCVYILFVKRKIYLYYNLTLKEIKVTKVLGRADVRVVRDVNFHIWDKLLHLDNWLAA